MREARARYRHKLGSSGFVRVDEDKAQDPVGKIVEIWRPRLEQHDLWAGFHSVLKVLLLQLQSVEYEQVSLRARRRTCHHCYRVSSMGDLLMDNWWCKSALALPCWIARGTSN